MRFLPLANRVIIDPIEESKVTAGNIVIPDIATRNKAVAFGRVLEVGPGRYTADGKLVACHVKKGDVVLFPRNAPAVLPLPDENGGETAVLMLEENSIIATVEGLPQKTSIVGLNGSLLAMEPQSLARPDVVYENIDAIDRSVFDLRRSGAPEDVIADVDIKDEPA